MGVPAHICAVGLYSGGNRRRLCLPLTSQNQAPLRESCPQGVTIPNAECSKDFLFQQLPLAFNLRVFRIDVAHFLKVVYGSLYGAFTYT